jgi:hypothetical protein
MSTPYITDEDRVLLNDTTHAIAKFLPTTALHLIASARVRWTQRGADNERALGIHTCHADCDREVCRLRRERDDYRRVLENICVDATWAEKEAYEVRAKWVRAKCAPKPTGA